VGAHNGPPRERRLELGLAALAMLLPLVWHLPYFSGEALLYDSDAAQAQYPRYRMLCDALQREREWPQWQTLVSGGSPLHGNPENPTLFPPVLALACFLGPVATMNATILMDLALGALGMFLLVRWLWRDLAPEQPRAGLLGASFAALAFSLGAFARAIHVNLIAYGAALALVPWMLWAAEGLLRRDRPARWAGILALLMALEVFSGGLFVIAYSLLLVALWILARGLLGGPGPRRRALSFGAAAAACFLALALAKYLPYREWVETTTRRGRLSYDEALGATLASSGADAFRGRAFLETVLAFTGGGLLLVLALLAWIRIRGSLVRWVAAFAALFFFASLGGPVHRLLYECVPPFDQVRSAVRAWTPVHVLLPVLAGLGLAWAASRWRVAGWSTPRAALVAAVALAGASALFARFPRDSVQRPEPTTALLARYERWPEAARLCGDDWRAFWLGRPRPGQRNEQFVSSALGAETVAGFLGNASPALLDRHLFGAAGEELSERTRKRRLGVLSVRWLVMRDGRKPAPERGEQLVPPFVDGTEVIENPQARARAVAPGAVIGIRGDADDALLYALLDDRVFPLQDASLVVLPEDASPAELASVSALVVGRAAGSPAAEVPSAPVPVLEIQLPLDEPSRTLLHELALRIAASAKPAQVCRFERWGSGGSRIELPGDGAARWITVSESWAIYAGWRVSGADAERALAIRRADGVASAVLLGPGDRELRARYAPDSTTLGLLGGALGLAGALLLILWPSRSPRQS
jgi:hypothetical protein